jgi:two-component system sensor histidine kinase RegB
MTSINLSWLVRLRWGAILGQLVTIGVVHHLMDIPLPLLPLLGLIALEAATNAVVLGWQRAGRQVQEWMLPATLALDVVILTGLLFFTGGPFNPFSFLYLVHIALAAVVLPAVWTWALTALSLVCSGALFYGHVWLKLDYSDPTKHAQHMRMHMEGMWIAVAVAAAFIVYFVTRIRRALQAERALAWRNERLAALGTLAAGAAHELATPLGTIAVVAQELTRRAEGAGAASLEDLRLIRAEVERCRTILNQMAAGAGEPAGEAAQPIGVGELVADAVRELSPVPPVTVDMRADAGTPLAVPPRALGRALRGIVKNAQEASSPGGSVALRVEAAVDSVRIAVEDRGSGMPAEVLARAGEPFFTTKPTGSGMGLGLFLARSLVEKVGGRLAISSLPGRGTTVSVVLPCAPTAAPPRAVAS